MTIRAWVGNWVARRHWRKFGEQNPYWAIITAPENQLDRVDVASFYATGLHDVADHLGWARSHQVVPEGPALDFGCGVGRLTLALGKYFPRVTGVDAASAMITLANQAKAGTDGVDFVLNERADLRVFPSAQFGFVYSHLVLQHLPPATSLNFLRELVRVCRPGGHLLVQWPSEDLRVRPVSLGRRIKRVVVRAIRRWAGSHPLMDVYPVPVEQVEAALRAAGAQLVARREDMSAGPEHPGWIYLARRT